MDYLNELKSEVFKRQKTLAKIVELHGQKSLFDYVAGWATPDAVINQPVVDIIARLAGNYMSEPDAQLLASQIQKSPLVSTVDHHGIFGHPFFLNANLLFSLKKELKYLPVFPTSGVSLNNSSWPGCLVLTNPNTGELARLSFFHDGHKTKAVFGALSIREAEVSRVLEQISQLEFLNAVQKEKLTGLVNKIFSSYLIQSQKTFSDQACVISQMLWQEIFPKAPKMVYLPLEDIVAEIIIKDVAINPDNILHKLLFTKNGLDLLEKYFTGVRGAFAKNRGSFLFWGVDDEDRRVALHREGLKVKDERLNLEYYLTTESISNALNDRHIYPTSLLCFLVMLNYNFNCLGGFNQTSWLTEIKVKFILLLKELGEKEKLTEVSKVVTDNFAETSLAFFFQNNQLTKPSALDLYINNVDYESLKEISKNITLELSLESELPEIYKIVVPAGERQVKLSNLNATYIARENGLTKLLGLV